MGDADPERSVAVLIKNTSPGLVLGPPVRDAGLSVTAIGAGGPSPELPVVAIDSLPAAVRAAVARTVAEHVGDAPFPARRAPWFRQGWIDPVLDWIAATGVRTSGPPRAVRMWSLSAVFQIPVTNDRDVWCKATCDHFRHEPRITQALARFAGAATPRVLAIDADRAWMLLEPLPPTTDAPERAIAAATTMATLAAASVDHLDTLRTAGCPDRDLTATLDAFDDVVRHGVELDRLPQATRATLIEMLPWVQRRLETFFEAGIPATLVHGDLHPGNVAGSDRPVIFDWTDACISHPYLDAAHLARFAPDAVQDAYAAAFGADHAQAWALAPFADQVFQAVTFEAIYRTQEHDPDGPLAGIGAQILTRLAAQYDAD